VRARPHGVFFVDALLVDGFAREAAEVFARVAVGAAFAARVVARNAREFLIVHTSHGESAETTTPALHGPRPKREADARTGIHFTHGAQRRVAARAARLIRS
jgi:hypothetical protein